MEEQQIAEIWQLFKEYLDKKNVEIAAERFVDLMADYGVQDDTLIATLGSDNHLDNAINYFLDLDDADKFDDELDDWDE